MSDVDPSLFGEVAEVVRGLVPRELGELRFRPRRYGIKAWYGPERPPHEHYEAQVIGADIVEAAEVLALEIGFHAEHSNVADNDNAIAVLRSCEEGWRSMIGDEAVVGPFLGRPDVWRRISETWPDPDLNGADLAFELGARLTDYITALEPRRRQR
jgi:hypothetical protein